MFSSTAMGFITEPRAERWDPDFVFLPYSLTLDQLFGLNATTAAELHYARCTMSNIWFDKMCRTIRCN